MWLFLAHIPTMPTSRPVVPRQNFSNWDTMWFSCRLPMVTQVTRHSGAGSLADKRYQEAQEAGRRFGVEYIVLDNPDGKLFPNT
jgi:hypothetical protein